MTIEGHRNFKKMAKSGIVTGLNLGATKFWTFFLLWLSGLEGQVQVLTQLLFLRQRAIQPWCMVKVLKGNFRPSCTFEGL